MAARGGLGFGGVAPKYWLQDYDTDQNSQDPPVQNTWYTIVNAEDMRGLLNVIRQRNDETDAKNIEVQWTIDGNVYFQSTAMNHNTWYYMYRYHDPSAGGTDGLLASTNIVNMAYYTDKRGLSFKVEMRITSAAGTNQDLVGRVVRETLEAT